MHALISIPARVHRGNPVQPALVPPVRAPASAQQAPEEGYAPYGIGNVRIHAAGSEAAAQPAGPPWLMRPAPAPLVLRRQPTGEDPPSARALALYESFKSSPRTRGPKLKDVKAFSLVTGLNFEEALNTPGATRESLAIGGWSYTFVVLNTWSTTEIFVREHQVGTDIVNYYRRGAIGTVDDTAAMNIDTSTGIFIEGKRQFDFGSAEFLEFYGLLDELFAGLREVQFTPEPPMLPDASAVSLSHFTITVAGEQSPLAVQRAERIKEDLVARGARAGRVSIVFGGTGAPPAISIQAVPAH